MPQTTPAAAAPLHGIVPSECVCHSHCSNPTHWRPPPSPYHHHPTTTTLIDRPLHRATYKQRCFQLARIWTPRGPTVGSRAHFRGFTTIACDATYVAQKGVRPQPWRPWPAILVAESKHRSAKLYAYMHGFTHTDKTNTSTGGPTCYMSGRHTCRTFRCYSFRAQRLKRHQSGT